MFDSADDNFVVHAMGPVPRAGTRVQRTPEFVLVDSGAASDTFNVACRFRLSSASAKQRIREALEFFRTGARPFTFWLMPGYTPAELPDLLQEAGLKPVATESAMKLELGTFEPLPPPSGLSIRRVQTHDDLTALSSVLSQTSEPPDLFVPVYFDSRATLFLDPHSPQLLYLGWLEGHPVATAELTVAAGVAGLYNIATVSRVRGRGVGTAMAGHCLAEARRSGLSQAILQASSEGESIYRRLGFSAFGAVTEFKPTEMGSATV